jgi:hypothetical protein
MVNSVRRCWRASHPETQDIGRALALGEASPKPGAGGSSLPVTPPPRWAPGRCPSRAR